MIKNITLKNRIIYYILNALIIFITLIPSLKWVSFGGYIAIMLLIFFLVVFRKRRSDEPACVNLPIFFFFDGLLFLALRVQSMRIYFSLESLTEFAGIALVPAGIGIFLCLISLNRQRWLGWIGSLVAGCAFILGIWSGGSALLQSPSSDCLSLIICYSVLASAWFFSAQISDQCALAENRKEVVNRNNWFGIILFIIFTASVIFEKDYYCAILPTMIELKQQLPLMLLSWWRVLIAVLLLLIVSVALCDLSKRTITPDAYVMLSLAGAIVLVSVYYHNYVKFNWGLLILYSLLTIYSLKPFLEERTLLRLNCYQFIPALIVALLLTNVALFYGLWLNVLFSIIIIVAIYSLTDYRTMDKHIRFLGIVVLLSVFSEAIAYSAWARFSPYNLTALIAVSAISIAFMVIIHKRNPGGRQPPRFVSVTVCFLLLLMCLPVCLRHGSKISIACDDSISTVSIDVKAVGKNNQIDSVSYYWTDFLGRRQTQSFLIDGLSDQTDIQGERIVVQSIDAYGIQTTRAFWIPR